MYTDIAWEYLRRNARYRECWERNFMVKNSTNQFRTLSNMAAREWGLLRLVNPYNPSPLDVFWCPCISKRTLYAKIHKCSFSDKFLRSDINMRLKYNFCSVEKDIICAKYYNEHGYVQILMPENDLIRNEDVSFYFSVNRGNLINNIRLINFLHDNDACLSDKCIMREIECLSFYDLYQNGLSQKEIAKVKYSNLFSEKEWECKDWLRARVRYKLKRATAYINNNYHEFI